MKEQNGAYQPSSKELNLALEISNALERLEKCWKKELNVQVSFVARVPGSETMDVFCSNDDPDEVIAAINRVRNRPKF